MRSTLRMSAGKSKAHPHLAYRVLSIPREVTEAPKPLRISGQGEAQSESNTAHANPELAYIGLPGPVRPRPGPTAV
ncbi:hypothetical protein BDBG_16542 [Blastomyces gilchristii SLH14081]|uniref:Uncharacterized protein n=1 Tax=Blastomyces gilchristii (strain SLH14081) TaxID=559298 RepID=A0A179UHS9_BLAGS|nr:uncharacterized protein BDBG_16542 [Blastomyces gilchristii SLH14081]OAT06032.1 hypothetical protein BDBG_16542 [Blastomyces gilchristii SLH14081]